MGKNRGFPAEKSERAKYVRELRSPEFVKVRSWAELAGHCGGWSSVIRAACLL
jgi:hypothetical protein